MDPPSGQTRGGLLPDQGRPLDQLGVGSQGESAIFGGLQEAIRKTVSLALAARMVHTGMAFASHVKIVWKRGFASRLLACQQVSAFCYEAMTVSRVSSNHD